MHWQQLQTSCRGQSYLSLSLSLFSSLPVAVAIAISIGSDMQKHTRWPSKATINNRNSQTNGDDNANLDSAADRTHLRPFEAIRATRIGLLLFRSSDRFCCSPACPPISTRLIRLARLLAGLSGCLVAKLACLLPTLL